MIKQVKSFTEDQLRQIRELMEELHSKPDSVCLYSTEQVLMWTIKNMWAEDVLVVLCEEEGRVTAYLIGAVAPSMTGEKEFSLVEVYSKAETKELNREVLPKLVKWAKMRGAVALTGITNNKFFVDRLGFREVGTLIRKEI